MAELRLISLAEALSQDRLAQLKRQLAELGVKDLADNDDAVDLEDALTEDQLTDFMDRLEAHDIACDVYLPIEFEGRIELGEQTFGSAHALADALEEVRDELDIEDDEDSEDDEEMDLEMIDEQLSYCWRVFSRACSACLERQVPLHIIP